MGLSRQAILEFLLESGYHLGLRRFLLALRQKAQAQGDSLYWELGIRRRFVHGGKAHLLTPDALGLLRQGDNVRPFLLVWDRVAKPVWLWRATMERYTMAATTLGSYCFPAVLWLAATPRREGEMRNALADVCRRRGGAGSFYTAPLGLAGPNWQPVAGGERREILDILTSWSEIPSWLITGQNRGDEESREQATPEEGHRGRRKRAIRILGEIPHSDGRQSGARQSGARQSGARPLPETPSLEDLVRMALALSPAEKELLWNVGGRPLLRLTDLALLQGVSRGEMAGRVERLEDYGLVTRLSLERIDVATRHRFALAPGGTVLLAAMRGETAGAFLRHGKVWDVAPDMVESRRPRLERELPHTLAVRDFFLILLALAREKPQDYELRLWDSEGESTRDFRLGGRQHHLRPDGYGEFRVGPAVYSFFLEIDRGTIAIQTASTGRSDYRKKFRGYFAYRRLLRSLGEVCPRILIVSEERRVEPVLEAVTRLARETGEVPIPVYVTSAAQLAARGPLGVIWRTMGHQGKLQAWG